jgi:siroheme synthase
MNATTHSFNEMQPGISAALAFRPIAGTPLTIHCCSCDDVPVGPAVISGFVI